jgi:glycosyltransferase involved in cell wall biosynthesis
MMKVGLHMIVKNEAPVIERCLQSVLPYIDWWAIADTGSTDGTQAIIQKTLGHLPGKLIERPWVNFGHNRQEALALAREVGGNEDYTLWIDADDVLKMALAQWPELSEPGYFLKVRYNNLEFNRIHLIKLNADWTWSGAVHECLMGNYTTRLDPAIKAEIVQFHDGARSKNPETYLRDIDLLKEELRKSPANPRTQFYLAQSFYDAGMYKDALIMYEIRTNNASGWSQEQDFALYRMAICMEALKYPQEDIKRAYTQAANKAPNRSESLVALARIYREEKVFILGYSLAKQALENKTDSNILFCEFDCYADGWRALDELAVSAYYLGKKEEGKKAALRAFELNPQNERLKSNIDYFR